MKNEDLIFELKKIAESDILLQEDRLKELVEESGKPLTVLRKKLNQYKPKKVKEDRPIPVPPKLKEEKQIIPTVQEINEAKILLGKVFESIKEIIKFYLDIPNDKVTLISLWIIGTYFHKNFETFPYLFFNAMKGSGKTRMLKLITALADEGKLLASLTESVMFRSSGTLGIDEFENLGSKEKQALRELLNASYKKGIKIQRMRKKKTFIGEEQVIEEFEPYKPIVMANIWGIEEVLSDRCITLILDKSANLEHIKLIEDFNEHPIIQQIKANMKVVKCMLCSVGLSGGIEKQWNLWVKLKYSTLSSLHTLDTQTSQNTQIIRENDEFFVKVDDSGLDGRNLELFFPLFIIAKELNAEILSECLVIAKGIVKNKKTEELVESKDITLTDFISKQSDDWYILKQLTNMFRQFTHDEEGENQWINATWLGRALKRLNLVKEKRRIGEGVQVILDINKAKDKMRMFEK